MKCKWKCGDSIFYDQTFPGFKSVLHKSKAKQNYKQNKDFFQLRFGLSFYYTITYSGID